MDLILVSLGGTAIQTDSNYQCSLVNSTDFQPRIPACTWRASCPSEESPRPALDAPSGQSVCLARSRSSLRGPLEFPDRPILKARVSWHSVRCCYSHGMVHLGCMLRR